MQKRQYLQAFACFLAIPAVLIAGGILFRLLDPEMARGHEDYVRNYRLLELARMGSLMGAAGLSLLLWITTCFLVLKSRQRSLGWLTLAAGGPIGFSVLAMLQDLAPAPDDLYQQFIRRLKVYWRVPLEIALFVSIWVLAYESTVLKRNLMISYESFMTGTPIETIISRQSASSGMWAFSEALEQCYLVVLIYLLWPLVFNLAGRFLTSRRTPADRPPSSSRH